MSSKVTAVDRTQEFAAAMDDIVAMLGKRVVWLTIDQFAQVSGHHYHTVWKWAARGELVTRQAKKGAAYRIHYTELVKFFDRQQGVA